VVRTLHHLACSGGTLISRCLAALPDVVLLSELNPTNRHGPAFNPSHPLALYAALGEPLPPEVVQAEFQHQMQQVLALCADRGADLVIREHSHSDFCLGSEVAPFQPVRAWLAPRHPLLSVVTLRHPLDSWLGLVAAEWHTQLEPATLRCYCERCQAFLDAYDDLEWIHYEAFCRQPVSEFRRLCDVLCLRFEATALERFAAIELSGNSGRRGAGGTGRSGHGPGTAAAVPADGVWGSDASRTLNWRSKLNDRFPAPQPSKQTERRPGGAKNAITSRKHPQIAHRIMQRRQTSLNRCVLAIGLILLDPAVLKVMHTLTQMPSDQSQRLGVVAGQEHLPGRFFTQEHRSLLQDPLDL
jgi:hypothetical protein